MKMPMKKFGSDPVEDNQKLSEKEAERQLKDANLKKEAEKKKKGDDKDDEQD